MTKVVVAVYGTLKKGLHNYRVMESAKWKYISNDYIQIKNLKDVGFPCIKLSEDSNKWLEVELYEVEDKEIFILDRLEWYVEWRENNHYNRIIITTLLDKQVSVYEYNDEIVDSEDSLESHFQRQTKSPRFYSWKK